MSQSTDAAASGRDLSRIAHDLNDMLTTIVGNADLILHDVGFSDAVREDVEEIQKAADGVRRIALELIPHEGRARLLARRRDRAHQLRLPL